MAPALPLRRGCRCRDDVPREVVWHGTCFRTRLDSGGAVSQRRRDSDENELAAISRIRSRGLVKDEPCERGRAKALPPLGAASGSAPASSALRTARLVIVEEGASLRDLEPPPSGCEHTLVVVQSRGERPADFAQRVHRRLCHLQQERQGVVWAVFLLGPRSDAEAQSARLQIGRWLNRHAELLPTKSSVLALHAPASLQPWLLTLFDVLLLDPGCPALSAHLRFDPPRRREPALAPLLPAAQGRRMEHVALRRGPPAELAWAQAAAHP